MSSSFDLSSSWPWLELGEGEELETDDALEGDDELEDEGGELGASTALRNLALDRTGVMGSTGDSDTGAAARGVRPFALPAVAERLSVSFTIDLAVRSDA